MIDITNPRDWRMRIWVRSGLYILVFLLALIGVLPLPPLQSLLLLAAIVVLFGSYLSGMLDADRWMNVLNPLLDMGLLYLLVRFGGESNPWDGLAYVWLAGIALVNFRRGRPGALPLYASIAWAVLMLANIGHPDWLLFFVGHSFGLGLLSMILLGFLRERKDGRRDPLTDALGRRAGLEELKELGTRLEAFSLAFVDLRGFKSINDLHGHSVGDEVLRAVAGRLKNAVREADVVIRYGGDEFVVASPLENLSDRLGEVMEAPVATTVGPIQVRADVGVMPWRRGCDIDRLLAQADAMMYERKRLARSSVA